MEIGSVTWCRWLVWGLLLCGLPGCAVYDPYRVWRFGADYNTERQLSAQVGEYDHLPPRPVPVRLMKWGYNVGPSPQRGSSYAIPAHSPTAPTQPPPIGVEPGGKYEDYDLPPMPIWPSRPPVPWQPPLPPQPSLLPSQPLLEPFGPTATAPRPEQRTSARAPVSATPAAWLFSAP